MEHCLDGSALPSQNMWPQEREGQGLGWASLLDDGGQLCAKVLAVEPLLKQDICGVFHVVPARAKGGQPSSPSGRLREGSREPGSARERFGLAGPAELAACFILLAQPSGHTWLSKKQRAPPK